MFSEYEVVKFDNQIYYYTITTTDQYIDISIFSNEEYIKLKDYESKFNTKKNILKVFRMIVISGCSMLKKIQNIKKIRRQNKMHIILIMNWIKILALSFVI